MQLRRGKERRSQKALRQSQFHASKNRLVVVTKMKNANSLEAKRMRKTERESPG